MKKKPISLIRPTYSMVSSDGSSAEIQLYGDVVSERPVDWWTDKPVEGNFIIESEFLEDIKSLEGCSDLTIRLNSYGGDSVVGMTIHNRLRELSRNGTKTKCVIDGVAMSAGSAIACACDTVQASDSTLFMIHKCWSYIWGGYNADELRHEAEGMDPYDKAYAGLYARKSGLSEEEILGMMSETTYMTGKEALEKGFVDELLEDDVELAASADKRYLFAKGRKIHMCPGMFVPDYIPTISKEPGEVSSDINIKPQSEAEGGKTMTVDEIRAAHPEVVSQIETDARSAMSAEKDEAVKAAVQAERDRLSAIDEIADKINDADLIKAAKYGEKPMSAQELAFEAVKRMESAGTSFLRAMEEDAKESHADNVPAAPGTQDVPESEKTEEQMMADARKVVQGLFHKEDKK